MSNTIIFFPMAVLEKGRNRNAFLKFLKCHNMFWYVKTFINQNGFGIPNKIVLYTGGAVGSISSMSRNSYKKINIIGWS